MGQYYSFPFSPFGRSEKVDLFDSVRTHVHFLIENSFKRTSPFFMDYHFNLLVTDSNLEWETKIANGIKKFEKRLLVKRVECTSKGKLSLKITVEGEVVEDNQPIPFKENYLVTH